MSVNRLTSAARTAFSRSTLTIRNQKMPDGSVRYCYIDGNGNEAPTLRVKPGDEVVLHLKNELKDLETGRTGGPPLPHHHTAVTVSTDPCQSGVMSPIATNLHFHGLTIPSKCHQDDVLKTSIQPSDPPFEYRFRIPQNEAPGLYWYHPHIHGYSRVDLLGGASGAIIVEGTERADKAVAGMPERVLVVRDQDVINPNAPPSGQSAVPAVLLDNDGDAVNTGTGGGTPAKDLSVNFVPVPYPDYSPAVIEMRPGERQLWRVLNASALTYLNLSVLLDGQAVRMGAVALDGVPMNANGGPDDFVYWGPRLGVPPGSRVEFIVEGPAEGRPKCW